MGWVIGMDEAGYGPNLGPLVVTATVWEVPDDPRRFDFWSGLQEVVSRSPGNDAFRIHVADSKQVYTASRGLGNLERSVLSLVQSCTGPVRSFGELCRLLTSGRNAESREQSTESQNRPGGIAFAGSPLSALRSPLSGEPWFCDADLPLPCREETERIDGLARRFSDCCSRGGLQLRAVRSDVVLTKRFNSVTRDCDSKGAALSQISLRLLRGVWDPNDPRPALILVDKHGGRNRYGDLLMEMMDGHMALCREESRAVSRYRIGAAEVRFQTKAEAHFPVAVASMISKYVRELAMTLFNRFWQQQLPDLKPTAGYPVDARRFKREIAEVQARLEISDEILWRER